MRCSLAWAICGALCLQSAVAFAQNHTPIKPNYGRTTRQVAYNSLPSPSASIGTGVQKVASTGMSSVIPQQGSVDMGLSSYSTPALPSYSYNAAPAVSAPAYSAPAYSAAPAYSSYGGDVYGGGYGVPCSDCGSGSCQGGCKLAHGLGGLKGILGKAHHGHGAHAGGWFGGIYYMRLWRTDDNFGRPVATDAAGNFALSTGQARMESANGLGIRLGKMLGNSTAVEFLYWQTFPQDKTAFNSASLAGGPLSSTIDYGSLTYDSTAGPGAVPVNDFFTDSQYMSVTRSFDYRNFEMNFLRLPFVNNCGRGRVALLAGARYFRADEELEIFSDDLNEIPGDDPNHELRYHGETENHMVGFQLGALLDYQFTNRLSGQISTKAGIYNNHIKHTQSVVGGAGGALIGAGPDAGQPYGLSSKKDDIAFLGELDAGLAYCVNSNWRITGGYKVLGVAGYANPVRQMPRGFNSLATAGLIQNDDSLILHGIYFGAEYCW